MGTDVFCCLLCISSAKILSVWNAVAAAENSHLHGRKAALLWKTRPFRHLQVSNWLMDASCHLLDWAGFLLGCVFLAYCRWLTATHKCTWSVFITFLRHASRRMCLKKHLIRASKAFSNVWNVGVSMVFIGIFRFRAILAAMEMQLLADTQSKKNPKKAAWQKTKYNNVKAIGSDLWRRLSWLFPRQGAADPILTCLVSLRRVSQPAFAESETCNNHCCHFHSHSDLLFVVAGEKKKTGISTGKRGKS